MTTKPECHVSVIFAREAHKAVIFRRGPTLWTQIILWDTDADTFAEGQWFKGYIYTNRCDVSPDGSKMIYFAAKHYKRFNPEAMTKNNWTAISRPPYLTALVMWDDLDDRGGGGHFENDETVYINMMDHAIQAHNQPLPEGFEVRSMFPKYELSQYGLSVGDGIYYNLLLEQRGWTRIEGDFSWNDSLHRYEHPVVVWQKDNLDHSYSLLWTMPLSGPDFRYTFKLVRHQDNSEFGLADREWVDWDQRGRLIYTNAGSLIMGILRSDRIEPVQIADFSENKVKLIQSPAWARTWDQSE